MHGVTAKLHFWWLTMEFVEKFADYHHMTVKHTPVRKHNEELHITTTSNKLSYVFFIIFIFSVLWKNEFYRWTFFSYFTAYQIIIFFFIIMAYLWQHDRNTIGKIYHSLYASFLIYKSTKYVCKSYTQIFAPYCAFLCWSQHLSKKWVGIRGRGAASHV